MFFACRTLQRALSTGCVWDARGDCSKRPHIFQINYQETAMNKDQVKGRVEEAKGKVKQVAGKMTGNQTLEIKGKIQKAAGKAQAGFGDLKNEVK
jgi:uncharacterized protein YjbJ (UPF0337 family)